MDIYTKYKFIIYVCEKIVKDLLKFSLLFSIIREILIENHRVESQMPEIFKKSGSQEEHMILACQNISKAFGTNEILKDASFHIEEREKAALVGINGAGKSTLFKIIVGK